MKKNLVLNTLLILSFFFPWVYAIDIVNYTIGVASGMNYLTQSSIFLIIVTAYAISFLLYSFIINNLTSLLYTLMTTVFLFFNLYLLTTQFTGISVVKLYGIVTATIILIILDIGLLSKFLNSNNAKI